MAPTQRGMTDAWARLVERLFCPGTFIPERACRAFVADLSELEAEARQQVALEPDLAVARYEDLLAACYEKTGELDDSGGSLGLWVDDLFCGWVEARQAAKADAEQTASLLLAWMDEDPHGYCLHLERVLLKVLDPRARAAFLRGIQARAGAGEDGRLLQPEAAPQRWVDALRAVYVADGLVKAYAALADSAGLGTEDCRTLAEMLLDRHQPQEALAWVERGMGLDRPRWERHGLNVLRRTVLVALGRGEEALQSAWTDFSDQPCRMSYEALEAMIPESERQTWRKRVLAVVEGARLEFRLDLLLTLQERDLVAHLLGQLSDPELEGLSHTLGEPAAALLEEGHPGLAARLWRAQALRILDSKRSKYYEVAILDLGRARTGFLAAGQGELWDRTVAQVRAEHRRKLGFMVEFERVVAGVTPVPQPTFLERARAQWRKGGPS